MPMQAPSSRARESRDARRYGGMPGGVDLQKRRQYFYVYLSSIWRKRIGAPELEAARPMHVEK